MMKLDPCEWADLPVPLGCEAPTVERDGEEFLVRYTDLVIGAVAEARLDVGELGEWQRQGGPPAGLHVDFHDPAELVAATRSRLDGLEAERAALEQKGRPRR